jgi:pyroglutamyl-peptidase
MKPTADIVLVTGFEPFGGERVNPAAQVAQGLAGEAVAGAVVHSLILPCVFGQSRAVLEEALDRLRPRWVLALGQAGGRHDLSLERVAINVDDARIADNAGAQPIDEPVVAGAPAAYFATLPIKAMVVALRSAGLPASVSQSAGTFVCNHVFFGLMHSLQSHPGARGGFMHLPLLPEQAARAAAPATPSMALATMIEGTRLALATACSTEADLRASGGAEN